MNNIERAKALLVWKQNRINKHSTLTASEISNFFAEQFIVIANERHYDANYDSYLEFLNDFKRDIKQLGHSVYKYLDAGDTVIMPMRASVERHDGKLTNYEAVMLLKYNKAGKIIEWREVCVEI